MIFNSDDKTTSITNRSTIREDEFLNSCNTEMNGNMMRIDNGINVNKNAKSQTEIINFVNNQSKLRQDRNNETKNSNGIESHNSSVNVSKQYKFISTNCVYCVMF